MLELSYASFIGGNRKNRPKLFSLFPDLPGCIAVGRTREETAHNMHEAIELHVQGMVEDKLPIPKSHTFAEHISVAA